MKFPTLYKKTNTGAIQSWQICVDKTVITTTFGHHGGKQQTLDETISEGKNIGKVNETTPEQQAENEAKSKWEKQLKKGYVKSIEDAQNKVVDDEFVKGGVAPMLAPNKIFGENANLKKKINWPAFIQPKLDGSRCIAIISPDGEVGLWSRTRKAIKSVPHINEALAQLAGKLGGNQEIVLDGELYNHGYKDRFGDLMSIIRKDAPDEIGLYKDIQLHVYDCIDETSFEQRNATVRGLSKHFSHPIQFVNTFSVKDEKEAMALAADFMKIGYEGGMLRNADSPYESGKRSNHLQKIKKFDDEEFKILEVKNGRGKYAKCAVFVLEVKPGVTFDCLAPGTVAQKQKFLTDETLWKNKKLTVKYQGYTDTDEPKPRFPIAKAIREDD